MIPLNLPQRSYIQGLWHLEEESGVRADESGNGNTLQDINTVLYGTGKIGNAADFELDNSEYLSITDVAQTGLDITGEISLSCWIKLETKASTLGANIYLMAKWGVASNMSYLLFISTATDKLYFLLSNDGTASISAISTTALSSTGVWYHIGATFNHTTDLMQIYIAGLADGDPVAKTTDIADKASPFTIGANSVGVSSLMDGLIDEPIVWNTCLTAAEVLQVKNIAAYRYGGRFMPFFM